MLPWLAANWATLLAGSSAGGGLFWAMWDSFRGEGCSDCCGRGCRSCKAVITGVAAELTKHDGCGCRFDDEAVTWCQGCDKLWQVVDMRWDTVGLLGRYRCRDCAPTDAEIQEWLAMEAVYVHDWLNAERKWLADQADLAQQARQAQARFEYEKAKRAEALERNKARAELEVRESLIYNVDAMVANATMQRLGMQQTDGNVGYYCVICNDHGHVPAYCPQRNDAVVVRADGRVIERRVNSSGELEDPHQHIFYADTGTSHMARQRCIVCKQMVEMKDLKTRKGVTKDGLQLEVDVTGILTAKEIKSRSPFRATDPPWVLDELGKTALEAKAETIIRTFGGDVVYTRFGHNTPKGT